MVWWQLWIWEFPDGAYFWLREKIEENPSKPEYILHGADLGACWYVRRDRNSEKNRKSVVHFALSLHDDFAVGIKCWSYRCGRGTDQWWAILSQGWENGRISAMGWKWKVRHGKRGNDIVDLYQGFGLIMTIQGKLFGNTSCRRN